ncbi:MAG: HesA/MoeB/ThiF family protein [Candidatus Helarchaeota archaeon]
MLIPVEEREELALNMPKMFSRVIFAGYDVRKFLDTTVFIGGAGGLGRIVADILNRCGFGKFIIVDKDIVSEENLNRMNHHEEDLGKSKSETLAKFLERTRNLPEIDKKFHVKTEWYLADIIAWDKLEELIRKSNLIFTCFDNEAARIEVNLYAVLSRKPLIDGGTSENALRGIVNNVLPGKTPCLECYYSYDTLIDLEPDESQIQIPKIPCGASLATTMNITGSLQADQGIKLVLNEPIPSQIRFSLEKDVSLQYFNLTPRKNCDTCGDIQEKR